MTQIDKATDRRKERRIVHRAVVILAYGLYQKMEFEEVVMVDCSASGVRLEMGRPLEPPLEFLLKMGAGSSMMLAYEVRRCLRMKNHYEIGAEYTGFVGPSEAVVEQRDVLEMLLAI
jgi:hypothetical protein